MKNSASVLLSFAQNAINSQAIKGGKSFSFSNFSSPSILLAKISSPSVVMAELQLTNDVPDGKSACGGQLFKP